MRISFCFPDNYILLLLHSHTLSQLTRSHFRVLQSQTLHPLLSKNQHLGLILNFILTLIFSFLLLHTPCNSPTRPALRCFLSLSTISTVFCGNQIANRNYFIPSNLSLAHKHLTLPSISLTYLFISTLNKATVTSHTHASALH